MRRLPGWLVLGMLIPASTLPSQTDARDPGGRWTIALSRGAASLSGASRGRGPEGEPLEFVPHRPALWGAAVGYGGKSLRGMLALRYGEPGLRLRGVPDESPALVILTENAFRLTALEGTVSLRLARLRGGPVLRLAAGGAVEWWAAAGSPTRSIAVLLGKASLETAVLGPVVAALEFGLGYSPASPFRETDLPDGFAARAMWRETIAGSLGIRF